MLDLKLNGNLVETISDGSWFSLPNGDRVSPAVAGWANDDGYTLEQSVPAEPAFPDAPTEGQQRAYRRDAYTLEADPIFFMSQRGEATTEEWLAKIEEIKARFPYPSPI